MSKSSQCKQGGTKAATSKNKDEMTQLKEEINNLKTERKDQTQKIKGLNKKVKDLESELANAKHGLESEAPDFLHVISGDTTENYQEKMRKLEEENQRLKSRHNDTDNGKIVDFEKADKENKSLREKVKSLEEDITSVRYDNERLRSKQADSNKERIKLQRENTSLEEDKNKQGITISELQTKIEDLKRNLEESQLEMKRMEKEIGRLKTQNTDSSKKDISRLQGENASLVKDLTKQETEISKLNKQMEDFDREMKTKEEKIEQLTRQLESRGQKKENKKGEKSSSAEKISRLEDEVEGLLDNNPAIAHLSDPNRPLSLGVKFSELYDNEWTDAMEELSDSLDERAVIKQLLEIVVESYQFCCEESDKFMDRINGTMEMFSGNLVSEMPKEISKTNKDFRKSLAVHCVYHLQEEFTNKNSIGNRGKKTKDYMKKCVQVCWFMTVQDPKVVINYKVTGQFDEDRFKAYTKKGKQVDYLVWPALYLHEGGPVISKGVAQGK